MKKLITYTALCLISILLLPSCKGKMGIMKRHYTKGYYVSHTKAKDKLPELKAQRAKADASEIASIKVLRSQDLKESLNTPVDTQPTKDLLASNVKQKKNASAKPVYKNINANSPVKSLKQTISKIGHGDHEGHGHSLFWIIIMVILILWLIGFLAGGVGLGGLIHILLVIALILFILWLLRVV